MKQKKILILSKYIPNNYIQACQKVGLKAEHRTDLKDIQNFNGLLLPGGEDIDPCIYGQKNVASNNTDIDFDKMTLECIKLFEKSNKPILGICLGCQYLNVFYGGTLYQDIKSHRDVMHRVRSKNRIITKVFGDEFIVNSEHHQCVDSLGEGLEIIAESQDGIVEAIIHKNKKILGVQWHPEEMLDSNGIKVFKIFKAMFDKKPL